MLKIEIESKAKTYLMKSRLPEGDFSSFFETENSKLAKLLSPYFFSCKGSKIILLDKRKTIIKVSEQSLNFETKDFKISLEILGRSNLRVPETAIVTGALMKSEDFLFLRSDDGEKCWQLASPIISIGSHPENDIVLEDRWVSSQHAVITRNDKAFVFKDLGSTNGSFLDKVKINQAELKSGQTLKLGRKEYYVSNVDGDFSSYSQSFEIKKLLGRALQFFSKDILLLRGPDSCGKKHFASELHQLLKQDQKLEFVDFRNIPKELQYGQLFGWSKGAFSGALENQPGLLGSIAGGTLILSGFESASSAVMSGLKQLVEKRNYRSLASNQQVSLKGSLVFIVKEFFEFESGLKFGLEPFCLEMPGLNKRTKDLLAYLELRIGRLDDSERSDLEKILKEKEWQLGWIEFFSVLTKLELAIESTNDGALESLRRLLS